MAAVTILIIDDDEDILIVEQSLLLGEGMEIITADSIESGMALVESEHPDIILLDYMFPEEPNFGINAARTIKSNYPSQTIFLVTSVNRDYLSRIQEKNTDIDEILIKPIDIDRMLRLVAKYTH